MSDVVFCAVQAAVGRYSGTKQTKKRRVAVMPHGEKREGRAKMRK
jgi:hypothetical protein